MVEITCGQCGRTYRVDGKFVGKKIRCKKCNRPIPIIAAAAEPSSDLPDLSELSDLPELSPDAPSAWEPEPAAAPIAVAPLPVPVQSGISITRWINLAAVFFILLGNFLFWPTQCHHPRQSPEKVVINGRTFSKPLPPVDHPFPWFALSLAGTGSAILFIDAVRRPRGPSKVTSYVTTLTGIVFCGIPALFYYATIGWRPVGQTDKTYGEAFCRRCVASTSNEDAGNTITVYFIGTRFFGASRRCDSCGSTVRTKWFCFGMPYFPLGSYRVIDIEYRNYISRKTSLDLKQVAIVYAIIYGIPAAMIALSSLFLFFVADR